MELLRKEEIRPEPGERIFRHGVIGPLVLLGAFGWPLPVAVLLHESLFSAARSLPWFVWLLVAPVALIGGALWALCLGSCAQFLRRTLAPTNWGLCVSPRGLVLPVRSYLNSHFPADGPIAVRFAWPEIAAARRRTEVVERSEGTRRTRERRPKLELELRGVETGPLEALIAAERTRPAPQSSFLGIKSRARFQHVPLLVARPGVLVADWFGRAALRALATHVSIEPGHELDLSGAPGVPLEQRLRDLCRRGELVAAHDLVRRELGCSLTEAHAHVARLAREAA